MEPSKTPGSLAGKLLVAAPTLVDPQFRETLVYIADHGAEGAFGLVLNRPIGQTLGDISDSGKVEGELGKVPVHYGGPVRPENVMLAFFTKPHDEDTIRCRFDLELSDMDELLEQGKVWIRAFAGYSGWGEGQLEGELAQQAWKVCLPVPGLFIDRFIHGLWGVYLSGDDRWQRLVDFLPEDPLNN